MNDDEKLRKQLDDYCLNNLEIIENIYNNYLEMVKVIELDDYWIWGKEQLAAMMLITEEKHAHLIEWLELQLERKNLDPFATPKASSYMIAKNDNGAIVLIYFRHKDSKIFKLQLMPSNIMNIMENGGKFSIGTKNNIDDSIIDDNDYSEDNI